MGKASKFIYGVGLYQIGRQLYQGAISYYNSYQEERPLKERLSVFRSDKEGSEWAIVTGASEGIGRSFALELARAGYNVKVVARSADKLAKVAEEARVINPAIKAEAVTLDVSKATPSEFGALFNERERTSVVINNAGIMKNQKLLQTDPAILESMIKTNVHPYVYMTKYALQHFAKQATEHTHLNALTFVSSTAAWADLPYFGPYAGTKTHNFILTNLVRTYISKCEVLRGQIKVQSLHPGCVTTNLNGFKSDMPDAVMPEECAMAALSDLPTQGTTCGAAKHTILGRVALPLIRNTLGPLNIKSSQDQFANDRQIVMEPFHDKE